MEVSKADKYLEFSQQTRLNKQQIDNLQRPNKRLAFTSTLRYHITFNLAPPERKSISDLQSENMEVLPPPPPTDVCAVPRFDLMGLPVELRTEILWFLVRKSTESESVNVASFETFPAIMRASHQLFAEVRRIWSNRALYLPRPLGMNVTNKEKCQANGIYAIYGATPRFLVMRVPVIFHFVYTTIEERLAGFDRVAKEYNLHPGSTLLIGRPFGQLPPPTGNAVKITLASYKNWNFIPRIGTISHGRVVRAVIPNLLPMFAWWSLSRITAVGELLTIDLVGIKEWLAFHQQLPFRLDPRGSTWRSCMASVLAAIIAFSPNVPKIRITGLGACLDAFLALWDAMPYEFNLWNNGHSIITRVVAWPYSEFIMCYELINDINEAGVKYRRCEGNHLGIHETIPAWVTKVWKARFERYVWEFAA